MSLGFSQQDGGRLGVVILAAGRSSRMGCPKLLLPWGQTSVIGHLLRQWRELGTAQVCVVHAAGDAALETELNQLGHPLENRIGNPDPGRGMFSSLQAAASWNGWGLELTHWALVLGDQPHLRSRTLRELIGFAASQPAKICQPARQGRPRHPVLLPKNAFFRLANSEAENLKGFLAGQEVALLELDDPGLDLDIDRPEDYRQALALAGSARED